MTPAVTSEMPWRVSAVEALPGFRLNVRFVDGTEGLIDMAPLIHAPTAGVFAMLIDPLRFGEVFVDLGAVAWPCGVDLAPETMYRSIQAHGTHAPGSGVPV